MGNAARSASRVVRQQSSISLLSYLTSLAVLIAFLPLLVRQLGSSVYGAWVLTGGLVNLIAVFDFGFYLTVERFVARYRWQDEARAEQALTTSVLALGGVGTIVGGSVFLLAPVWADQVGVTGAEAATRYAGVSLLLTLLTKGFQGGLEGAGHVALARVIQALSTITFSIGAVLVARLATHDLPALGLFLLAQTGAFLAISALVLIREWGHIPFRPPDRATRREVATYALPIQAAAAIGSALDPASRVLVGVFVGPAAVTPLDIALRARNAWFGAALAFCRPLVPNLGRLGRPAADAAQALTPSWRLFSIVATAAGFFLAILVISLFPAIFGSEIGNTAAAYSAVAIISWIPAVISLFPYGFLVLYGGPRDLVLLQTIASGVGLLIAVPIFLVAGGWAPILGSAAALPPAMVVTWRLARARGAGSDSFRFDQVPYRTLGHAIIGVLGAALVLTVPLPVLVAIPGAAAVWLALLRREVAQLAHAL